MTKFIRMEWQWLKDVPAHRTCGWTLPTLSFELFRRAMYPYFTMVLLVGRKSYGFRIYLITEEKGGEK